MNINLIILCQNQKNTMNKLKLLLKACWGINAKISKIDSCQKEFMSEFFGKLIRRKTLDYPKMLVLI
ncbi:hypothetical protein EVI01_15410 [Enterococcus villorum]|uniref:Uncharacterized protein n=1 Tax=Enterococcus villorum TaxID=112904 RepID=A0A511J2M3_9ENTE|nr:hypothetical protein EVI01_15410 [Enterococcus villorum]